VGRGGGIRVLPRVVGGLFYARRPAERMGTWTADKPSQGTSEAPAQDARSAMASAFLLSRAGRLQSCALSERRMFIQIAT